MGNDFNLSGLVYGSLIPANINPVRKWMIGQGSYQDPHSQLCLGNISTDAYWKAFKIVVFVFQCIVVERRIE